MAIERPLSPHLQVYKPQITSAMSIFHRITGVALSVGTLVLTYWLISLACGTDAYDCFREIAGSIFGQILLIGWSWALFFHLCTGLRHLYWDMGKGITNDSVALSGWVAIIMSFILTALLWILL